MLRSYLAALATASLLTAAPADAQFAMKTSSEGMGTPPPPLAWDDQRYRTDRREFFSYVRARGRGPAPVAIFIDGFGDLEDTDRYPGEWMPTFLRDQGFALARVTKQYGRPKLAEKLDVMVAGIAEILARAEEFGIDRNRVVLVGRGWGGGLAALIASDPDVAERAGVDFGSIRGALILDGDGFDIPALAAAASDFRRRQLTRWAGDPDGQRRLSAVHQAAAPNAPRFQLHAVEDDAPSVAQARALAEALRPAGTEVELLVVQPALWKANVTFPGAPDNPNNPAMRRFLEEAVR